MRWFTAGQKTEAFECGIRNAEGGNWSSEIGNWKVEELRHRAEEFEFGMGNTEFGRRAVEDRCQVSGVRSEGRCQRTEDRSQISG